MVPEAESTTATASVPSLWSGVPVWPWYVQQAGKAETEQAISAAHGAYKAWASTPVSERETIFFRAADALASKAKEIVGERTGDDDLVTRHLF